MDFKYLHVNEYNPFSLEKLLKKTPFAFEVIVEKEILRKGEYFIVKKMGGALVAMYSILKLRPFVFFFSNDLYAVGRAKLPAGQKNGR